MEAQAHGRQQRARGINLSRMPLFVQLCVLLIVAVLALNLVLLWRIGGSPDSRTDDTKCTSTCTDHSTDKPVVWVYAKAVSFYFKCSEAHILACVYSRSSISFWGEF